MTVNVDQTPRVSRQRPGRESRLVAGAGPAGDTLGTAVLVGLAAVVFSVLMVVAGVGFGVAVIRARVLPRWTGA